MTYLQAFFDIVGINEVLTFVICFIIAGGVLISLVDKYLE